MKFSARPDVTGFKCYVCGGVHGYGNVFTCPPCGVGGILDVQYDYDKAFPVLKAQPRLRSARQ